MDRPSARASRTATREAAPRAPRAARRSGLLTAPATLLAGTAVALLLARRAWESVAGLRHAAATPGALAPTHLDDLVATGVLTLGAGLAAWYALTAAVILGLRVCRGDAGPLVSAAVRRWGAPGLRRAVLGSAAAGVSIALAMAPAAAAPPSADAPTATAPPEVWGTETGGVADLGWGAPVDPGEPGSPESAGPPAPPPAPAEGAPHPVPPLGTATAEAPTRHPAPEPVPRHAGTPTKKAPLPAPLAASPEPAPLAASPEPTPLAASPEPAPPGAPASSSTHTVTAGESLWSIAALHLGARASEEQIAAAWPRWYAANEDVVGPDPDLIRPGQRLLAPTEEAP
ncbi:LysM peptidoglycan-binding domain-containing protein [Georgenia sp. AZ-5]|uniref:LysM peptidoglycan-binding domain-containing protein n=1 Tax=Georgenia sp. AZ-5 TaxID=3367526 RepID=UPI0037540758